MSFRLIRMRCRGEYVPEVLFFLITFKTCWKLFSYGFRGKNLFVWKFENLMSYNSHRMISKLTLDMSRVNFSFMI